jgi:flagellar biosynthesis protein FlhF
MDVAEKFAPLGIDRVVFTKLDEAVGLGVIVNVICRLNLRLSYFTTGQDVPDDIEVGHRQRIAQIVLNQNRLFDRSANGNALVAPIDHLA